MNPSKPNSCKITLPSGLKASIDVPTNIDMDLAELSLKAFLGGLFALSKCASSEVRRDFLIRFVASILNDADISVRSVQMANKTQGNPQQIIEDLLNSLHHKNP